MKLKTINICSIEKASRQHLFIIKKLAANIAENGQLQPILISSKEAPDGRYYTLLDGNDRLLALQLLGRATVKAFVFQPGEVPDQPGSDRPINCQPSRCMSRDCYFFRRRRSFGSHKCKWESDDDTPRCLNPNAIKYTKAGVK